MSVERGLLEGRFAPVTFAIGFLECDFDALVEVFHQWNLTTNSSTTYERFHSVLSQGLQRLEPLNRPRQQLLCRTRSAWVAVFSATTNNSSDIAESTVIYMSKKLLCRGVHFYITPIKLNKNTGIYYSGTRGMALYSPREVPRRPEAFRWHLRRSIYVYPPTEDGWEYRESGDPLPFERPDQYRNPDVSRRVTVDLLAEYARRLGIDLFNEAFYGDEFCHFYLTEPVGDSFVPQTYRDVQARWGLSEPDE